MYEIALMQNMSEQQRMMFQSQMATVRKDPTVGVLLALFLGGLGAHQFYLRRNGLGVLYAVFFWTFIPSIIAFVECFLMSERVRVFNDAQAQLIATQISVLYPGTAAPPQAQNPLAAACQKCQQLLTPGTRFCSACGQGVTA
jgi:TM2 domain-containing membrane protein YozV